MRNYPLQFLREETLAHIQDVHTNLEEVRKTADSLGLPRQIVEENWNAISDHKWLVSERVGRDVGPLVATLDYLTNLVHASGQNPSSDARPKRKNWLAEMSRALLQNLDGDGPRSLVNFELAMRGTRSLAK